MLLAALITSFRTLYDLEPSAADIQQAIDSGDLEARVFQSDLDALKFEWAEGSQIWSGHLLDPGEFAVVVAFILPQKKRPSRAAVSAVIERRPERISLRRLCGMPVALAAASWVMRIGTKNSSCRMMPGCRRESLVFMFGAGSVNATPSKFCL